MRQRADLVFTAALVACVAWAVFQGALWLLAQITGLPLPRGWGPRAGLFPTIVGLPVLALGIAQLVLALRTRARRLNPEGTASEAASEPLSADVVLHRSIAIAAALVGFAAAIWLIGFTAAIPLVTLAYLRLAAREAWPLSVGLAAAGGIGFYLVFVLLLKVTLPPGLLLEALFG